MIPLKLRTHLHSFVKGCLLIIWCFISMHVANSQPKYELRGVWIATVSNIDWPSKKGLSATEQQAEFTQMLDSLQHIGINAVFVQVRPAADAFYPSSLEPWSEYLSGTQGVAPAPYYDPLQFMIDETHKRAMEFHAWINPYRAVFNIHNASIAKNHITKTHPEWFITYGDKKYFNPGLPQVMDYVNTVIADLISRYDIDGLHLDDYFYPYRIQGKSFPDDATYKKYGNGLSKDAWRRSNCDSIVQKIHQTVLELKPLIRFGISPFGVWRNKAIDSLGSDTKAGVSNYDDLYADILLWLRNGWIDYVAPQLYWAINHPLCDYTTLLQWWSDHTYGKQLYIGHGIYRKYETKEAAWQTTTELPNEINLIRDNKNVQGSMFFSMKCILRNPNGWADSLQQNYYKNPAIVPPMDWVDTIAPLPPIINNIIYDEIYNDSASFYLKGSLQATGETQEIKNIVFYLAENKADLKKLPSKIIAINKQPLFTGIILQSTISNTWNQIFLASTSVDRENNESELSNIIAFRRTDKGWVIDKK